MGIRRIAREVGLGVGTVAARPSTDRQRTWESFFADETEKAQGDPSSEHQGGVTRPPDIDDLAT